MHQASELLEEDVFNNSILNQRHFIITRSPGLRAAVAVERDPNEYSNVVVQVSRLRM